MHGLTKRQKEILEYIETYIKKYEVSPSFREIQAYFKFSSLGTVSNFVRALKEKGAISKNRHKNRSILPIPTTPEQEFISEVEIPFIGYLTADEPIEMFSSSQKLAVPHFMVKTADRTYAMKCRGDSLRSEFIRDGDFLIIEARSDARAGDTIIGQTSNKQSFVKKYYPEGSSVRLESESSEVKEITVNHEDIMIFAVLVSIIRLY